MANGRVKSWRDIGNAGRRQMAQPRGNDQPATVTPQTSSRTGRPPVDPQTLAGGYANRYMPPANANKPPAWLGSGGASGGKTPSKTKGQNQENIMDPRHAAGMDPEWRPSSHRDPGVFDEHIMDPRRAAGLDVGIPESAPVAGGARPGVPPWMVGPGINPLTQLLSNIWRKPKQTEAALPYSQGDPARPPAWMGDHAGGVYDVLPQPLLTGGELSPDNFYSGLTLPPLTAPPSSGGGGGFGTRYGGWGGGGGYDYGAYTPYKNIPPWYMNLFSLNWER